MRTTMLGAAGPTVPAIGLGCMGMSAHYGERDDVRAVATLRHALDLGVRLIDTSASYGDGHNETLVGGAVAGRRDEVFLCTKFGIRRDEGSMRIDSTPGWARESCERSLRRLGVDHIDLFYLHRRDPAVPIEETVAAMADLVRAGKVRHLGLSEVHPDTLRRAHGVHPITALQSEYSLFSREVEDDVRPVCAELGVGFVAYSPLGRALLTGEVAADTVFGEGDLRAGNPRFAAAHRPANLELVARLRTVARDLGVTAAQAALAWLCARGVVPIPGTTRAERVAENAAAADLCLTDAQLAAIEDAVPRASVAGYRLSASAARLVGF